MLLQSSFLAALISLNWEWLTTEPYGVALLVTTTILAIGTLIFYVLTGAIDPGFVRNQIFDNAYETTEFIEEDEQ